MVFKSFQTTNTNMLLGESFFRGRPRRAKIQRVPEFPLFSFIVHLYFIYISTLWIIMVQKATAVTTVAICCSPKTALPLKFCHSTSDSFWFLASMVLLGVRSNGWTFLPRNAIKKWADFYESRAKSQTDFLGKMEDLLLILLRHVLSWKVTRVASDMHRAAKIFKCF